MPNDTETPTNEAQDVKVTLSKEAQEAQAGPPLEMSPEELMARLKEKEDEAHTNYDRMLRMAAEFENYKRRSERERAEYLKYASEGLARALLPVIDNLERALGHARDDNSDKESLIGGIDLILKEFLTTMEKFGLKRIDAEGTTFDPQHHEAVMVEENNTVEDNTVIRELQKGYSFQDRLLRPSMVVVSKRTGGA
ncbi:MAG: nucleotide exchange factor GrpE [Pseudomonadota bacterium]